MDDLPVSTERPGLVTKAVNFATAAVAHAANGFREADDATAEARHSLCRDCPVYVPGNDSCSACGCVMRVKTRWAGQRCPMGQWEAVA